MNNNCTQSTLFTLLFINLIYIVPGRSLGKRIKREEQGEAWWKTKKFRIGYCETETFLIPNANNILFIPNDKGNQVPYFEVCESNDMHVCHNSERIIGFDGFGNNIVLQRKNEVTAYKFSNLEVVETIIEGSRDFINLQFNKSKYVKVEDSNDLESQYKLILSHQKTKFILCKEDVCKWKDCSKEELSVHEKMFTEKDSFLKNIFEYALFVINYLIS